MRKTTIDVLKTSRAYVELTASYWNCVVLHVLHWNLFRTCCFVVYVLSLNNVVQLVCLWTGWTCYKRSLLSLCIYTRLAFTKTTYLPILYKQKQLVKEITTLATLHRLFKESDYGRYLTVPDNIMDQLWLQIYRSYKYWFSICFQCDRETCAFSLWQSKK